MRSEPVLRPPRIIINDASTLGVSAARGRAQEVLVASVVQGVAPFPGTSFTGQRLGPDLERAAPTQHFGADDGTNTLFAVYLAAAPDGRFAVAWSTSSGAFEFDVYAQFFTADGQPVRPPVRVNQFPFNNQVITGIGMAADGTTVFVWQSLGQDGSGFGIVARQFTATGQPLGDEFLVPTRSSFNQRTGRVAVEPDGDFTIGWASQDLQSGYDIYARRYNAAAQPLGPEFLVNDVRAADQVDPLLGVDSQGRLVIVWETHPLDGPFSTSARQFDSGGQPLGPQFLPTGPPNGRSQLPKALAVHPDGRWGILWFGSESPDEPKLWLRYFWPDGRATDDLLVGASSLAVALVLDERGAPIVIGDTAPLYGGPLQVQRVAFRGDADANGFVGLEDYALWAAQFGQHGPNQTADYNFDGQVAAADYTIWAALFAMSDAGVSADFNGGSPMGAGIETQRPIAWGRAAPPPGSPVVPTPPIAAMSGTPVDRVLAQSERGLRVTALLANAAPVPADASRAVNPLWNRVLAKLR